MKQARLLEALFGGEYAKARNQGSRISDFFKKSSQGEKRGFDKIRS
jgi:hypothetical protein